MTYQKISQTHDDEASLLLTSVTASPAPSFSFGQGGGGGGGGGGFLATMKKTVPTMRAMIVTCVLLGTLAMIYGGRGSSSSGSSTPTLGTVAVVTSDDRCATEVLGAGPCCDGHPVHDECHQVCDWLLLCDNGYVPERTDDEATRFPETSDYQPHNCHCRGYDDHNGCFCRQVREMVYKFENNDLIGDCDPCLPPPTPAPTTPVYDPNHDYCFYNRVSEQHCWYPTQDYRNGNWKLQHIGGDDSCDFPECPEPPPPPPPPVYDPSYDFCFKDNDNAGKYCWYPNDRLPDGNWKGEGGHAYNDCGDLCTDVADDPSGNGPCLPPTNTFGGVSLTNYAWAFINSNPFQTCYQYGDEDKYCWSNSYWESKLAPKLPGWLECQPKGYTGDDKEGWHAIKQKNMRYVNPPPQSPGDPYTCGLSIGGVGGVPCQDVHHSGANPDNGGGTL